MQGGGPHQQREAICQIKGKDRIAETKGSMDLTLRRKYYHRSMTKASERFPVMAVKDYILEYFFRGDVHRGLRPAAALGLVVARWRIIANPLINKPPPSSPKGHAVTGYLAFSSTDNFRLMGNGVPTPQSSIPVACNFFKSPARSRGCSSGLVKP